MSQNSECPEYCQAATETAIEAATRASFSPFKLWRASGEFGSCKMISIDGGHDLLTWENGKTSTEAEANTWLVQRKTLGQLLASCLFSSDNEVISPENSPGVSFASYAFSKDTLRTRSNRALHVGIVGINSSIISDNVAPSIGSPHLHSICPRSILAISYSRCLRYGIKIGWGQTKRNRKSGKEIRNRRTSRN